MAVKAERNVVLRTVLDMFDGKRANLFIRCNVDKYVFYDTWSLYQ